MLNAWKENVKEQNSGDQKHGKFAGAAVMGRGKGKQPSYKQKIQLEEVRSDSESQDKMAYIASAMKASVKLFWYLAMLTRSKGAGTSPSPPLEPVCGLPHLPPCALLTMILWVTSTARVA
jgi:hypothetical protein